MNSTNKDLLEIPASLTFYNTIIKRHYTKKDKTVSVYNIKYKKAVIRITSIDLANQLKSISKENRAITMILTKRKGKYVFDLHRVKKGISLQVRSGLRPHLQIVANGFISGSDLNNLYETGKKSVTMQIKIRLHKYEWGEIDIKPSSFLINVEKEAKSLLDFSLRNGFNLKEITKGRGYDLAICGPNKTNFLIAISRYGKTSKILRRKEKIINKVLNDISKLLVYSYKEKCVPIIVSLPIETKKTRFYTTHHYLNFYKETFNFKFITTTFKKDWEIGVYRDLMNIDKENKNV